MFTWGSKGGEKSLKPFGALFEIKGKKTGFKKLPNMGKKEHKTHTHTHIQARTLSSNYRQRQPLSREDVCNPKFNRGGGLPCWSAAQGDPKLWEEWIWTVMLSSACFWGYICISCDVWAACAHSSTGCSQYSWETQTESLPENSSCYSIYELYSFWSPYVHKCT